MGVDIGKLTSLVKQKCALDGLKQNQMKTGNIFDSQDYNNTIVAEDSVVEAEEEKVKPATPEELKKLFDEAEEICSYKSFAQFVFSKIVELGTALYEKNEKDDKSLNINNKIDERVQQKGTGDCYMLTTLNALNCTPEGQDIISNLVTHNEKLHTYTVNFPGVDVSYTFSASSIARAENKTYEKVSADGVRGVGNSWYSEGDDDVLLLEMAFERFREDVKDGRYDNKDWPDFVYSSSNYNENKSALDSGSMAQVYYMMTGEEPSFVENTDHNPDAIHDTLDRIKDSGRPYAIYASINAKNGYEEDVNGDYYIDYFNGNAIKKIDDTTPDDVQRYSFTGGGSNSYNRITLTGIDKEGNNSSISLTNNSDGGHALAITSITDDTLTIINPWDSDKEVTVNREDFEGYMNNVQFACLAKQGVKQRIS